ncbi:Hypothetical predicted protein [Scomber scombrus]|uniref:Uncharacterized protein n=1 Tax=Scomber scombrus TaxID=13677 RepID=A0AAV1PH03_SCOSC
MPAGGTLTREGGPADPKWCRLKTGGIQSFKMGRLRRLQQWHRCSFRRNRTDRKQTEDTESQKRGEIMEAMSVLDAQMVPRNPDISLHLHPPPTTRQV